MQHDHGLAGGRAALEVGDVVVLDPRRLLDEARPLPFALGDEGWRSFRNGCAGADPERVVGNVPDLGGNPLVARGRGRCEDASAGGDGGIEWDGAGGYLYLTDRLPRDRGRRSVR